MIAAPASGILGSMVDPELFNQLKAELSVDEGERAWPYDDATGQRITFLRTGGNITIAIGRNLFGRPLADDEIELMFRNDVTIAIDAARRFFPKFDEWTQSRRAAVAGLIFNMGEERFSKFSRTIEAMNAGRWLDASTHLLDSRWATQVQPSRRDRIAKQVRDG